MTWGVSTTDVLNTTGVSVPAATVALADASVTIYVNRTPSASAALGARDLYWIRSAIQWQAAWLPDQPGYAGRSHFDSMSQDGVSITSMPQWAKNLAPMAARALKNLSWKGTRSSKLASIDVPAGIALDFTQEESDRYSEWRTV